MMKKRCQQEAGSGHTEDDKCLIQRGLKGASVCVKVVTQDCAYVTCNFYCWGKRGHTEIKVNLCKRGCPQIKEPASK
jgi:hypothetical protein